jgi:hypothetical protein
MTYPHMQMILSAIANLQVDPRPSRVDIEGTSTTAATPRCFAARDSTVMFVSDQLGA